MHLQLALALTAVMQDAPKMSLDPEMRRQFSPHSLLVLADLCDVPPGSECALDVGFMQGDQPFIEISGVVEADDGGAMFSREYPVAFTPLSVTEHSARTNRVYVVGWIEGTEQAVVEEWTLGPLKRVEGDAARLDPPQVTVRELHRSEAGSLGPAWDIATYPEANALLYLERSVSGATVLRAIDLSAGAIRTFETAADVSEMRTLWSLRSTERGRVIRATPNVYRALRCGYGFVWPKEIAVLVDGDRDGLIDDATVYPYSEYTALKFGPYSDVD